MIPAETSVFASLSGGIASLNHRLSNDDALRATVFLGVARVFGRTSIRPYSYALIITCLICYMPGRIFIAGSA